MGGMAQEGLSQKWEASPYVKVYSNTRATAENYRFSCFLGKGQLLHSCSNLFKLLL